MLLFAVKRYRRLKQQKTIQSDTLMNKVSSEYSVGNNSPTFCFPSANATSITKFRCPFDKPKAQTSEEQVENIQIAQAFLQRMQHVRCFMEDDLLACDAKWSLFVTAAMSYHFENLLRPFPEMYTVSVSTNNGDKNDDEVELQPDITQLYEVISEMPKLSIVLRNIATRNYEHFKLRSMDLLHWVLVLARDPQLRTLRLEEVNCFFQRLSNVPLPQFDAYSYDGSLTHVFEVIPYEENQPLSYYCKQQQHYPAKVAFYGGRLEKFYSLLHTGNLPDDKPLILATDLKEALRRSPLCAGWGASRCGAIISCVAVCEVIDNPDYIQIIDDKYNHNNMDVVVLDGGYMRISHLIFFGHSCKILEKMRIQQFTEINESVIDITNWLKRHKRFVSFSVYMAFVGIRWWLWQTCHTTLLG